MGVVSNPDASLGQGGGIPPSEKGQPGGVATLDNTGIVPAGQLPPPPSGGGGLSEAEVDARVIRHVQAKPPNGTPYVPPPDVGPGSVAVGSSAQALGNGQVSIGATAGIGNTKPYAVSIGYHAEASNNAVCVGGNTGAGIYSIGIGYGTQVGGAFTTAVGCLITASFNECTYLGYGSSASGDNQVQLGNSATTTYVYGSVQSRSDQRDKANIRECELGLDFINELKPTEWQWDYREDYAKELFIVPNRPTLPDQADYQSDAHYAAAVELYNIAYDEWNTVNEQRKAWMANPTKDGSKIRGRFHAGLIAQDVKQTLTKLGVDWGGYQNHAVNGGDPVESIGYIELIAPMIKAIQQLSDQVQQLKQQLGQ